MRRGVFVDLDRTLLRRSSGVWWGFVMTLCGFTSLRFAFWGIVLTPFYVFGVIDLQTTLSRMFASMRGHDAQRLYQVTAQRCKKDLFPLLNKRMLAAIRNHKARGDHVVLVTESFDAVARPFANYLGIPYLATCIGTRHGVLTGKIRACMGKNKGHLIQQYASVHSIDLAKSYAYADSIRDVSMLSLVGHAFAVNPRMSMRSIARRRSWKIVTT